MIKSQDDIKKPEIRQSDVLISALEKCKEQEQTIQGLEAELKEVLTVLLKVSPEHEEWVAWNFPRYIKELDK